MNYLKKNFVKFIELILSLILAIGSFTVFAACPLSEEHVMACHYAQLAVTTLGVILVVQSLAAVIISNEKVKLGITLAQIPTAAAVFLVPGTIFSLCMMSSMRCISIFQPAVKVISAIVFVVSVADVVISVIKKNKQGVSK